MYSIVEESNLAVYASTLQSSEKPIAERFNSLFCLRTLATLEAIEAVIQAFKLEKDSELLLHEICYCLGQMNKNEENTLRIQAFLEEVIDNPNESKIVLHEAVEAMGNLNQQNSLKLIKKFVPEDSKELETNEDILYETCFLAQQLILWKTETENGKKEGLNLQKLKFTSNDPAPPFNYIREPKYKEIPFLQSILLDKVNYNLFERYRALFTLRELNTEESVFAICSTLSKDNSHKCSNLLKHEVAFVLAQMEGVNRAGVQNLLDAVNNEQEAAIVKHELLVSLGDMVDEPSKLVQFLGHKDKIVDESCQIALSYIEFRKQQKLKEEQQKETNNQE